MSEISERGFGIAMACGIAGILALNLGPLPIGNAYTALGTALVVLGWIVFAVEAVSGE